MSKGNRHVALGFGESTAPSPAVLGGKGAGLAELATLGLPVPPGFTITTSVARAFAQHGRLPKRLDWQLTWGIESLERATGKKFGESTNPLLVSVRSGAAVSMPGMMDTVLNLGLNLDITRGLAKVTDPRFAWDCYRRFLCLFGQVVLGIPGEWFEEITKSISSASGMHDARYFTAEVLEKTCIEYRAMVETATEQPVPDDPRDQLERALLAVLASWNNPRAKAYRLANGISNSLGTAVNIQSMVYGNRDVDSGTGVVFSCNCATGAPGLWGEWLIRAQGEDIVSGICTPRPIAHLATWNSDLYQQLAGIVKTLAVRRQQVVDIEFTVESGKLYILQVRNAKLAPEAAATVATHLVWDKQVTKFEALSRVTDQQVKALQALGFNSDALSKAAAEGLLGHGLAASPGAAVGTVVTTAQEAVEAAAKGQPVVLVRPDTSPDDLAGMLAAVAIVTKTGGATSHAAVVARGAGKPAVVGCAKLKVSPGQLVSVDGQSGLVVAGRVELAESADKKEVNLFLRWWDEAESRKGAKPRLVFETFGESRHVETLLSDFYLVDYIYRMADNTKLASECARLRTQVHTAVAERLSMYLVVAISGEVRHLYSVADKRWDKCRQEVESLVQEFKIELSGSSCTAHEVTINQLKTMSHQQHLRFVQLVAAVFEKGAWGPMVGGKKWAVIAQAAYGFLAGKINHSIFADHAFDLEHNGGCVFGKHDMLVCDRYRVKRLLDQKKAATSVIDLRTRISQTFSPSLPTYSPEVETLFQKGDQLGLWNAATRKQGSPTTTSAPPLPGLAKKK